jgi:NAD(P)-dependent dehydrogenase (short-subunit alcohol dehydrogenase family)
VDLKDQSVVVMGGSSGIGLATAKVLAKSGARVTITGRDKSKLDAACLHSNMAGEVVDATSATALTTFYQQLGPFDHLVLTLSGGEGGGPFPKLDINALRRGFEGKFWPQISAAQAALNTLRNNGSLTFVTAVSARRANPNTAGLAAINGALEAMVRVLAAELKPLRVNAVSPGVIETPWWDRIPEKQRRTMLASLASAAAVGRVGRPEEVAEAIVFLVGNDFMTGAIIECDGGLKLI